MNKNFHLFRDWDEYPVFWSLTVLCITLGALFLVIRIDDNSWQSFSAAHHCYDSGRTREVEPVIIMQKIGSVYIPQVYPQADQHAYVCDDNLVHWR